MKSSLKVVSDAQKRVEEALAKRDYAIRHAYRHGWSMREIASALGWASPSFVHRIIHRK